jgi:CubicO group peptidase (beta-lactamase class C family)
VNDGNAHHAHQGLAGHAGLFGTARDLAVLLDLLLNRGSLDGHRLMQEETVRAFLTPHRPGRALGWQTPDWAPRGSFSHSGFTGTFVLGVPSRDGGPKGGLALVLLTNRQNMGTDPDGRYADLAPLQEAVARAVLGDPVR